MYKTVRVMRRALLSRMYQHLQQQYDFNRPHEAFLSGTLTDHELDAILAFKSDQSLNELRNALNRLSDGTYGVCLLCKQRIPQRMLDVDPVLRLCGKCEQKMNHADREYSNTAS